MFKVLVYIKEINPNVKITFIADRGSDFFNIYYEYLKNLDINIIIRAKHDRVIEGHKKLFEIVKEEKILAKNKITVQRISSRSVNDSGRIVREAELSIRAKAIFIPSPDKKTNLAVPLNIIHVYEESPPTDDDRLEWFLITGISIEKSFNVVEIVKEYAGRWHIEIWHKILKSDGCNVEQINHRTVERIVRNLSIDMVIAWHAMLFRDYGIYNDEFSSEMTFNKLERLIMEKISLARNIEVPSTHKNALILQATLGGYLNRDGTKPGYKSIKEGALRLSDKVDGYVMAIEDVCNNLDKILASLKDGNSIPRDKIDNLRDELMTIIK